MTEVTASENASKTDRKQQKRPFFAVITLLLILLLTLVAISYEHSVVNRLAIGLCLLLGISYRTVFLRDDDYQENKLFYKSLRNTIPIAAAIVTAGIFVGHLHMLMCVSYVAAFLLPLIILEAWKLFGQLSTRYCEVWYYTYKLPGKPIFLYQENIQVRMKIKSGNDEHSATTIMSKYLKLGLGFYFTLEEQKHIGGFEVKFEREEKNSCGWVFYTSKFGLWKRFLNPEKTLAENRITANARIVAIQVCPAATDATPLLPTVPEQTKYDGDYR